VDRSIEQPVSGVGDGASVGRGKGKVKPYPDNGFVDADGRLTDLAHQKLAEFFAAYPEPMRVLASAGMRKQYPKVCAWAMAVYEAGQIVDADLGDELNADIRLSVAAGIRRYDPVKAAERGTSLTTYLIHWVVNGVTRTRTRMEREGRIRTVPIGRRRDAQAGVIGENGLPAAHEADQSNAAEPLGVFHLAMGRLDPETATLVRRRVLDGDRLRDVAADAGVSKESARQKVKRGVARLAELAELEL
jgi:DNA-directed RNA polymerase specialized sigma24 family protein